MNPRHCLTCRHWTRHEDRALGYCEIEKEILPINKIRFQFELCDCGGYIFAEHRQPHREQYHALRELEAAR